MGIGALLDRVAYQEAIWCLGRSVICHVQGLLFKNTLKSRPVLGNQCQLSSQLFSFLCVGHS